MINLCKGYDQSNICMTTKNKEILEKNQRLFQEMNELKMEIRKVNKHNEWMRQEIKRLVKHYEVKYDKEKESDNDCCNKRTKDIEDNIYELGYNILECNADLKRCNDKLNELRPNSKTEL